MSDNYPRQSTGEIEYIKVAMFRPNMDSIPSYSLPSGYSFQLYKPNSNDDQKWAEIAAAAGEFRSVEQAQERFRQDFLNNKDSHLLSERLYFLVNSEGKYIGQAMGWSVELDGKQQDALCWVSIIPEYQGKKLAKPLVSTVLKKISEYSNKCCLKSKTTSWRAINMYDDFGFKPYMNTEHSEKAWKLLSDICKKNFLDNQ
jgi:ribosomal protein S18 acetylase RimI-like enzyme